MIFLLTALLIGSTHAKPEKAVGDWSRESASGSSESAVGDMSGSDDSYRNYNRWVNAYAGWRPDSSEGTVGLPTCACAGGNQKGTKSGDTVCEWNGGNCSKFREGCPNPCIMQKAVEAEKAVGDASGSDEGYRRWGNYGNYVSYGRYDSSEKAVGDASGSDEGYRRWGNYRNYRSYGGYGSSEKAVGDASGSDEGYRYYGNSRYYGGYGSSEKAVGDSYEWWRSPYQYYGSGSYDAASSIFAVSMKTPAKTVRNIFALLGLAAVVYGASMHYFAGKDGSAIHTQMSPIV